MEMSDKHGARMADELGKDTRAGHEELRELTPDAERTDVPRPEGTLEEDEAELRSELAASIDPSVFPARPDQLLAAAEANFAPEWVRGALRVLPDGVYDNVQQVWQAIGGTIETKRG